MSPFRVLFLEFFGQFFASELVTSDIKLRQSIIAVLAALMTPAFFISISSFQAFESARLRAPQLILPMTRMLATLFVAFSVVSVGLIGAIVWDSLSFDRRDAMVLGPLPLNRITVVRAKLAAMAALLVGASLSINILSGLAFSLAASSGLDQAVRLFVAHVATTSFAALFMFSLIVILRALVGVVARGHVAAALGSLVQFSFISALLCFFLLAPTAMNSTRLGRGRGVTIRLADLPAWMPSRYFLAVHEQLRGTGDAGMGDTAWLVVLVTLALAAAAVLLTVAAYHHQFRSALSPAVSTSYGGGARIARALARVVTGGNRLAFATADFILTSIARNRTQQAPIAINAAIGAVFLTIKMIARDGLTPDAHAVAVALAVPLIAVYWAAIGLRAAFFVPAELKAAWIFRASGPTATSAYALGTRAAIIGLVGPPVLVAALAGGAWAGGSQGAMRHAVFVLLLAAALGNLVVATIGQLPFTRPYQPGHAKLKTRWPLYLLGAIVVDRLAGLEMAVWNNPGGFYILLACIVLIVAILDWAVRRAGRGWRLESPDEFEEDEDALTVLNLGSAPVVPARLASIPNR